ncbi:uncharacterized protein METZ01_LOCUS508902, partial [marine metagenome]
VDDGIIPFAVDFSDLAGNAGTPQTTVLTGSDVTYDKTAPIISSAVITSSNANNSLAKVGDVISVAITSAEDLYSLASTTIAGQIVQATDITSTNATTWIFQYAMDSTDTEGAVAFSFTANDLAGDNTAVTAATSGLVMFDKTAPTLSTVEIVSNNANTSYAKLGDVVSLTISSDEDLIVAPTVLLGGHATAIATIDARNYIATTTMVSTDIEGPISISIQYTDLYGNIGT